MMMKLGFDSCWVDLVMKCVTSVKYKIWVNGDLIEEIIPERGLCQGDPISSYLFLICVEGFSALLIEVEAEGRIHGIQVCRGAPTVSHLLFVDDSLIMCHATIEEAEALKQLLAIYEECSGQVINTTKSAIMFNPNTNDSPRSGVMQTLNIAAETMNERYLGLPVYVGRDQSKVFVYLKERIW